jgi:hypothetical protein
VDAGGLCRGRFRRENREFSGPSSGPETPPDVSGSFCCAFWWYFQPRSSILDPFRDTQIFAIAENQLLAFLQRPLWPPGVTVDGNNLAPPDPCFFIGFRAMVSRNHMILYGLVTQAFFEHFIRFASCHRLLWEFRFTMPGWRGRHARGCSSA